MLTLFDKDVHSFSVFALSPTRMFAETSIETSCLDRYASRVSLVSFSKLVCVSLVWGVASCCRTFRRNLTRGQSVAVRWMADLEELEPYDGREGAIQRMGRDVRGSLSGS